MYPPQQGQAPRGHQGKQLKLLLELGLHCSYMILNGIPSGWVHSGRRLTQPKLGGRHLWHSQKELHLGIPGSCSSGPAPWASGSSVPCSSMIRLFNGNNFNPSTLTAKTEKMVWELWSASYNSGWMMSQARPRIASSLFLISTVRWKIGNTYNVVLRYFAM